VSSASDPPTGHAGDWVELAIAVLDPGGRAPGLPPETGSTPLVACVKGFLEQDARAGEPAAIRTLAGRRVEGTLHRLDPAPRHSFGRPQPELLAIGPELRAALDG
jgi:hypothetical protein